MTGRLPSVEKDAPEWETQWAVAGRLYEDEPWTVFPGDGCPNRENAVWLAEQRNRRPDCSGEWAAVSRQVTQWTATTPSGSEVCSCASGRGVRDCPQHSETRVTSPGGSDA